MISNKMKKLVEGSSIIRAMFEDGKKLKEKLGAENVFDYSLGNPSIVPPASVKKAIIDIAQNEPEMLLHGYMSNSGYEDVRQTIAKSLNKKYKTDFSLKNIIMTVGAAGGLNVALKAILNPDDEVIVLAPFFGEYASYISNYDGVMVVVEPNYSNFSIDFKSFEEKITAKTKAVIINSPNNPSGAIYSKEDIKKIAEILEKKQKEFNSVIYIISDEPYREIAFNDVEVPYLTNYYDNTIVGYSYSKTLSLPGERIGYLAVSNKADSFDKLIVALEVANRILGFVNAPSLMQKVIAKCVDDTSDLAVYEENKNILYNALTEYGYEVVEPKGTFYMLPKAPIADDKEFCEAAKEFGLVIVPGTAFHCSGYFRIAYCVDKETVIKSLPAFKKLIDKYKA